MNDATLSSTTPPQSAPARRLEAAFHQIAVTHMAGVPILNPQLRVEAVGFREWRGHNLGVLITPWFMNLICLPSAPGGGEKLASGSKQDMTLPSGEYEFLTAWEESLGPYLTSSLFSPMFEFPDQDLARKVALAVLREIFTPAQAGGAAAPERFSGKREAPTSRRAFLSTFLPRERRP